MPHTADGGRVGEAGHAILDQRHRLDLHPADAHWPLQPEVEPAFSELHLTLEVGVPSERLQPARRQHLGNQGIGQPGVDRDQYAGIFHQHEVEARLAPGVIELGQPAGPAGGQQVRQTPGVGQVSGDPVALDLSGDPKAVVVPSEWPFLSVMVRRTKRPAISGGNLTRPIIRRVAGMASDDLTTGGG